MTIDDVNRNDMKKGLRKGGFNNYGGVMLGPNQNPKINSGPTLLPVIMSYFSRLPLFEAAAILDDEIDILIDFMYLKTTKENKIEDEEITFESGATLTVVTSGKNLYIYRFDADGINNTLTLKELISELRDKTGITKASIVAPPNKYDTKALSIIIPEKDYSIEFKSKINNTDLEEENWIRVIFNQVGRRRVVQSTKDAVDKHKWSDFVEYSDDLISKMFYDIEDFKYKNLKNEYDNDGSILIAYDVETENGYEVNDLLSSNSSLHVLFEDIAKRFTAIDYGLQTGSSIDQYEMTKVPGIIALPSS